jgi:SAM-dependent methyltransferase
LRPIEGLCPSCGSEALQLFYSVDDIPVNSCLVVDSREAGRSFPRGDLRIAVCDACGYITNTAFDLNRLRYDPAYEETQTFSATFSEFEDELIEQILADHDLFGKTVVEIGCGKGTFLARMAELGRIRGIGIDPTSIKERLTGVAAENVTFLNEFYSEKHAAIETDLIACRHALEHIPDVAGFLRTIRKAVGSRPTPIFFELPEMRRILRDTAYWDIYFEHCGYFTPGSLARAFEAQRFDVTNVRLGYDDQYLMLEAKTADRPGPRYSLTLDQPADILTDVEAFERNVGETLAAWREYFERAGRLGKRIAIWGSGSKCVAFLTTLRIDEEVAAVTDVNHYRHGKFLIGTGKEIVAPEQLRNERPDEVIVMNSIYRDEVAAKLDSLGIVTHVITADTPLGAIA